MNIGMEQKAAHERQPSIGFSHKPPFKSGQLTVHTVRGRPAHNNLVEAAFVSIRMTDFNFITD
jgi:hypothetical protein